MADTEMKKDCKSNSLTVQGRQKETREIESFKCVIVSVCVQTLWQYEKECALQRAPQILVRGFFMTQPSHFTQICHSKNVTNGISYNVYKYLFI